jgi:hypothetical protein
VDVFDELKYFLNNFAISRKKISDHLFAIEDRMVMPNTNYFLVRCDEYGIRDPFAVGVFLFEKRKPEELVQTIQQLSLY